MFNPEMMKAASQMMANMSAEDMKRMSEMASKMDPNVMQNMMQGMGQAPPGDIDMKQMSEQMKNMSPEQMRQGLAQAQGQMSAQKQYVYNGAMVLKNEGNALIKKEEYAKALEAYSRALDNLKPHGTFDDVKQLRLQLLQNASLCNLKLKEYQKCIDQCEEALTINDASVKAIFRRGLARWELGQFPSALADVQRAHKLSPEDKTVGVELARLQNEASERGVEEAEVREAEKEAEKEAKKRKVAAPAAPVMPPGGLPAGIDREQYAKMSEVMLNNPDVMKTAMESLKAMPEEERKKLMAERGMAQGVSDADLDRMSSAFSDPNTMRQMSEMAKTMSANGAMGGDADMMSKAAEMLASNPEMGTQMANMMKNMPPEQLQQMMELSQKMRQGGGGGSSGGDPMGGMDPSSVDDLMNNPEMMKAAEDMMRNIDPKMLSAMAKAQGVEMDEGKEKMLARLLPLLPYLMKGMRFFQKVRKGFRTVFSSRGRIVLAAVILLAALIQHYRSG